MASSSERIFDVRFRFGAEASRRYFQDADAGLRGSGVVLHRRGLHIEGICGDDWRCSCAERALIMRLFLRFLNQSVEELGQTLRGGALSFATGAVVHSTRGCGSELCLF